MYNNKHIKSEECFMCTAVTYKTKNFYFGRNLDYEVSFNEKVTLTPQNFPLIFRDMSNVLNHHYAMIGMACIADNYPLYYDAVNEKGLGIAGLNFVGNAKYNVTLKNKYNIAQFEVIPWILCQCASVAEVRTLLKKSNITNKNFNDKLSAAQLHWIIADRYEAITVECVAEGIKIYNNPLGVLTNNPPFDMQLFNLNNYIKLSSKSPENSFSNKIKFDIYSRGMGTIGLPGDLSSQSRFVRASFVKLNSVSETTEYESIAQFFHILNSVSQPRGCCNVGKGKYEYTIYTSCCNADKGIYYYTTYNNHQINAVNMRKEKITGDSLISYPVILNEQINFQN